MSVLKGIIIMYILAISVAKTQLDNMMGKICMICENNRVSYTIPYFRCHWMKKYKTYLGKIHWVVITFTLHFN